MVSKSIIEMAREAGFSDWALQTPQDLKHFAQLVRADENKACQEVCDDLYRAWTLRDDEDEIAHPDPIDCKLAIRARGNP